MIMNLGYNKNWDNISKNELADTYYCTIALSCALEYINKDNNPYKIIQNVISKYPEKSNEELWYLSLLTLLEIRTRRNKSYFVNNVIKNMITKYSNSSFPEDFLGKLESINMFIPYEGFFISLYDNITKDDIMLYTAVSIKDEIRPQCEKYFTFKNCKKDFIERTIKKEFANDKYINPYDFIFDILVMFIVHAVSDIEMNGNPFDETDVRANIFHKVEEFSDSVFVRSKNTISNIICSALAKKKLAVEG